MPSKQPGYEEIQRVSIVASKSRMRNSRITWVLLDIHGYTYCDVTGSEREHICQRFFLLHMQLGWNMLAPWHVDEPNNQLHPHPSVRMNARRLIVAAWFDFNREITHPVECWYSSSRWCSLGARLFFVCAFFLWIQWPGSNSEFLTWQSGTCCCMNPTLVFIKTKLRISTKISELVVWNIWIIFPCVYTYIYIVYIYIYYMECHNPNWRLIFFRGVALPPTSEPFPVLDGHQSIGTRHIDIISLPLSPAWPDTICYIHLYTVTHLK